MNGQLNSNIYNASSSEDIEELQQEIDSLNASVDSLNDRIDETNTALEDYKKANKTQVSTADIKSDSATITNLSSNAIKGNTLCITGTSNLNDISVDDINAKGNIEAVSVSAPSIAATKLNADNGEITTLKAVDATITNANAVNIKGSSISITGESTLGAVTAVSITSNSLTADTIKGKIVSTNVKSDNAEITSLTADVITSPEANITKTVSKDIKSDTAEIGKITATNETVDNLTINKTLTVANGITLPNSLGDTTLTKTTTNKLVVNGDSELNGAVKAGSITVPDGAITAGEICIGAKGVVIDKDKNAAFADISSSNITAENIDVNTKITASCVEAKDVVSTNNFACNFYPENITIDKDVGNLHYSYQLDTDDEGGVLVDCKTVLPIEGATGVITKYKDTESNTINEDSIVYTNEKNGIKIVSNAEADKTTNTIDFDTGSNVFTVKADETGFSILTDGEKSFGISTDGKVEQTIDNCPNDVRTDNILKANEDGSLYTGCVDILGDASKKYGGWTKTKKENYCDCCLVTNYDTGTVQRCHVSRSLDNGIYDTFCVTTKSGSNTDYRNVCVGHNNQSKWDYYTCCCSYVEDGSTKKFENDYSEHSDNTGFKTFTTRIAKDDKVVSIDTIQNKTCLTKALPTVFERHITNGVIPDCNELAWKVCINDSNLYITNPQKTTDAGCVEDILRVEDGKIYTKCGEFTSGGGSGGFFTDSDFENDCMTGTRTVVDDTITTCMETTKPANGISCYNFEIDKPTSISFGYGTNCYSNSELDENNYCKQTYVYPKDYCYTNYLNNRIYPSICVERSTKNSSKNTIKEDFEYNVSTGVVKYNNHTSNDAGNITSNTTFEGTCDKYTCCVNSCRSTTDVNCCQNAVYRTEPNNIFCCINRIWNQKSNPIYCSDYTCEYCNYTDDNGNFTRYTNQYTVCSTCDMPIINYNNYSCCHAVIDAFICSTEIQTKDVEEGDETEICLGSYNKSTGDWVYCYQRSSGTLCGCSYEYDSGSYETCCEYYPNYECISTYTRFFNGDHLNGCMYNTSTEQYDYFDIQNCVNLDTKSIDKQVMIANCYIMVRSQVFDKQTTDLPITNSLVPLAGTINGNGFAFFCKGSDGIKFYDNEFNTVDAGTATSITYISNQGQN